MTTLLSYNHFGFSNLAEITQTNNYGMKAPRVLRGGLDGT